jgi:hypothetical protein
MMLLYVPSLTKSTKGEGRWSQLCCLLLLLVALCPYYLSSTWVIVKLAMKKSDDIELCLRAWKWEAIGKKVKRRICTLTVATTTLLSVLSCATNEKTWTGLLDRTFLFLLTSCISSLYGQRCGHAKTTPRLMSQNNVRLLNREKLQKAASAHTKFRERYLDSTTMTDLMRPMGQVDRCAPPGPRPSSPWHLGFGVHRSGL